MSSSQGGSGGQPIDQILSRPGHTEYRDPFEAERRETRSHSTSPSRRAKTTSYEEQPGSQEADQQTFARHVTRPSPSSQDLESQTPPAYDIDNDPLQLSLRLKSDKEIDAIRANTSRKRDGIAGLTFTKDANKARKLQIFYENQNQNITRMLRSVDEHVRIAKEFDGENHLKYKIAVRGSFVCNVFLVALQLYAAASTGSLALIATMADAVFDPMSNITLILCNRAVAKVDPHKFPSGKARIETAGNIVFCSLMVCVSVVVIAFSCRDLAAKDGTRVFSIPAIVAVAIALGTKFVLFLYCWALRNVYSQVRILWEDHRNDLFVNGFGLFTNIAGAKVATWIDPAGGICISVLIIALWLQTAYKEFLLLIGVSAETEFLSWITYISMTHSPMIKGIDTVRAYHSGPRVVVEVDVVIDQDETLKTAHDVAEALQEKIERLPKVERAYVHIDYETSHKPEHFLKKEL